MNKKSFLILLLSAVFALCSIVFGMKHSKDETEKITANLVGETLSTKSDKKTKKNKDKAVNNLSADDLYLDANHVYLAKKISDKKISDVKKAVKGSDDQLELVESAKNKWAALKEVNNLFSENVLKGDKLTEATLKSETNDSDTERVRNIIEETLPDDGFKKALLAVLSGDEASYTDEASEQTVDESNDNEDNSDSSYAESLVSVLVNDEGVRPSMEFTYEDYANAVNAVNSLSEGETKDYLNGQLAKVLEAYPWLQ